MTVKERMGRQRYIAFEATDGPPLDREEVIRAVKRISRDYPRDMKPWVVLVEGSKGLLRCSHLHRDDALRLLRELGEPECLGRRIRTLGTSGTIKSAQQKYLQR